MRDKQGKKKKNHRYYHFVESLISTLDFQQSVITFGFDQLYDF